MVITNRAIYNVHKKEMKRRIALSDFGGVSKTVAPSKGNEFTVHVPSSYDYRFTSTRQVEIVDILKKVFLCETKHNLPIFHVTTKNLKDFTTTEDDMKAQKSRFPTEDYRAFEEDLIQMEQPKLKTQESTVEDQLNNYEQN